MPRTQVRAKGLTERAVVMHHALRNAFVAFVPAIVSDLGLLFGAALAVDYIFQLGGIGSLFIGLLQLNADANVPVDTYELQLGPAVRRRRHARRLHARRDPPRPARPAHEARLRWRVCPQSASAPAPAAQRRPSRRPGGAWLGNGCHGLRLHPPGDLPHRAFGPHFASPALVAPHGQVARTIPDLRGWNLFGTDAIGENLLVRMLYGLHSSEITALVATAMATILGVALGSIAGYRGGWLDVVIMRICDLLESSAPGGVLAVYADFTPVTA